MHITIICLALFTGVGLATPSSPSSTRQEGLAQFGTLLNQTILSTLQNISTADPRGKRSKSCTLDNLYVRKPWGSLTKHERRSYTNAVKCLQRLPSKTPQSLVPGARTRYDDFVQTHIRQTLTIHYTANFLAWHRWFTWVYEQTLREECGYEGAQPYWNWGLYAHNLLESPIFDGSDSSMSGQGAPVPNKGNITLSLGDYPPVYLPPGDGGGCVTSGPFKDMSVNLGPVSLPLNNGSVLGDGVGLQHNPRCLKRDISPRVNQAYAKFSDILDLIINHDTIADFQLAMQGVPGSGSIGVHGGGHYTVGGDPADDVFVSPGDPIFWLHHGMIDLTWWVWQNQDLAKRGNAIAGTRTFLNNPPSANGTLEDVVDLDYAGGGQIKMKDLMSTTGGPFCYVYSL